MSDGVSNSWGHIGKSNVPPGRPDYYGTISVPMGNCPTLTKDSTNGSGIVMSSSTRSLPGDPMRPKGDRLSDEIRKLEEDNEAYTDEFRLIRDQIFAARAVLGMERPTPGVSMKLSTALKELVIELDKRSDIFGNIDPAIKL